MADERLRLEYVALATVALWDRNPKLHDVGGIIESIERYGFKDPPKFEPHLNDGEGGLAEGNGRAICLQMMKAEGREPPRGVLIVDGDWTVPILFGVDAESEQAAAAYAIDHNNLTLSGGDFDGFEMARLWDDSYTEMLTGVEDLPVTVPGELLDIFKAFSLDTLPSESPEETKGAGVIRFAFGELKADFGFDFYSQFVQKVMDVGDIEEVLRACLDTKD